MTDRTIGKIHLFIALVLAYSLSIWIFVTPFGGIKTMPLLEAFAGGLPLLFIAVVFAIVAYLVRRRYKSAHCKAAFIGVLLIVPLAAIWIDSDNLFVTESPTQRAERLYNQCILQHIDAAKTNASVNAIRHSCRKLYPALNNTALIDPFSHNQN